jgi:hypothetical protein
VEDWTVFWIVHPEQPGDALILYLGPSEYR